MSTPHPRGHRWAAFARSVIDYHAGICWVCGLGHGGARQVDHVEAVTDRPDLMYAMENCRAAHGAPGNPCPACSAACNRKIHCNQLRSGYTVERARRIIAGYAEAAKQGKTMPRRETGYTSGQGKAPSPGDRETGRAW